MIITDRIQLKYQQRAYVDTNVSQHKMMHESKLLKNIPFNFGNVQEESVSKSTLSKTDILLEQKIESKVQSEIEVYTVEPYNSDPPGWTEHWTESMKTMKILEVLSIITINLLYGYEGKTESYLIYHEDLATFVLISLLRYQSRVVANRLGIY